MQLPTDVRQVIVQFAARFPLQPTEEGCQIWTHTLCEQLAWSFPSAGWGHKKADATRPHSKDAVALRSPFIGWDVLLGAGTGSPALSLAGESIDLAGQVFEPVTPVDHLGLPPPDPLPPPVTNLDARVAQLEADMRDVEHALRHAAVAFDQV